MKEDTLKEVETNRIKYKEEVKKVIYEDIYQYQVLNVSGGSGQINNLLTR